MGLETDIPVFSTTIPKRCEVSKNAARTSIRISGNPYRPVYSRILKNYPKQRRIHCAPGVALFELIFHNLYLNSGIGLFYADSDFFGNRTVVYLPREKVEREIFG